MNVNIDVKRRRLLQLGGLGLLALAGGWRLVSTKTVPTAGRESAFFVPDLEMELTARVREVQVLKGGLTRVWKFSGRVLQGPEDSVRELPESYLGPILRLRKGQRVRVHFTHDLPDPCIVHWHGLHVPEQADGHPRYAIDKGQRYVYEFEVHNRAGTYFYHAHTHGITAEQVYMGLAGPLIVHDEQDQALGLPSGEHDVALVIQDRRFDAYNQFQYLSHMPERMHGFLGDRILVNGQPNFVLTVGTRPYRFRLANASNSRIYKLGWEDGTPLTVIASDGGLLEQPERLPYLMLAPGERAELWADFSHHPVGSELVMRSLAYSGVEAMQHGGMGGGMIGGGMGGARRGGMMGRGMMGMAAGGPENGAAFSVFKVRVGRKEVVDLSLPGRLSTITPLRREDAANMQAPRSIMLRMGHMAPTLNGRSFEMLGVAPEETIPLNSLQLIEFDNRGPMAPGMMEEMMRMAHPMHIHGQQFQLVERVIDPGHEVDYATVKDGFLQRGWKDTVLVMPGERVRLLKRFDDFEGLFLYHCHNLEHEDLDMMRNFAVRAAARP